MWLLANVTTSTPAALIASKELVAARKWNSFGCSVPRLVTALSKLTIVRSASDSSGTIGPKACCGSLSSLAVRSVKCTSPAKARVRSPAGDGAGEGDAATAGADEAAGAGATGAGAVPHPVRPASAIRARGHRRVNTSQRYGL